MNVTFNGGTWECQACAKEKNSASPLCSVMLPCKDSFTNFLYGHNKST